MTVPVLSRQSFLVLPSASRYAPPFTTTPFFAALVSAHTVATGVASTSAHGHASTSSTHALYSHSVPVSPTMYGTVARHSAAATTTGVYTLANASTTRSPCVRFVCASSTSRPSLAMVECSAVVSATISRYPVMLIDPPYTLSPAAFSMGIDSPVSMLSSHDESPADTSPSIGTRSPVLTASTIPLVTLSTSITSPLSARVAVSGCILSTLSRASFAFSIARVSSHSDRPKRTITEAASVYSWIAHAPITARDISVLMSMMRIRIALYARMRTGGMPTATEASPKYLNHSQESMKWTYERTQRAVATMMCRGSGCLCLALSALFTCALSPAAFSLSTSVEADNLVASCFTVTVFVGTETFTSIRPRPSDEQSSSSLWTRGTSDGQQIPFTLSVVVVMVTATMRSRGFDVEVPRLSTMRRSERIRMRPCDVITQFELTCQSRLQAPPSEQLFLCSSQVSLSGQVFMM